MLNIVELMRIRHALSDNAIATRDEMHELEWGSDERNEKKVAVAKLEVLMAKLSVMEAELELEKALEKI